MRSSKSRSRSKSNRQRSPLGNIVNRVFDSSGPEGKVRGTPQQIIDKYLTLARDAQLSNDRVAAENFLQHAEHYARLLGEAQRELDAQRQQFGGNGEQPRERDEFRRDEQGEPRRDDVEDGARDDREPRREERREDRRDGRREDRREPPRDAVAAAAEVIDTAGEEAAVLVETPEMREETPAETEAPREPRARRPRRPKAPKAEGEQPPSPSEAAE